MMLFARNSLTLMTLQLLCLRSLFTLALKMRSHNPMAITMTGVDKNLLPLSVPSIMKRDISFRGLGVGAVLSYVLGKTALAQAAEEAQFVTTDSGLQYRDIKVGEGASPVPGDTVRVHYTGWLEGFDSEKKFDSSYDRRNPLTFRVGMRQVIAGWDEGILTNLKVGGKRELIIPAPLGYGARGAGGVIPPNATLYFRIELVGLGAR